VVSNPDADHIGGFLDVFDAFPVETVYVSGDPNNTLTYNTFLRGVRDEGARTEVLRTGTLMDWGGVRTDVIAPPTEAEGGLFSEINDNSVAILLTYGTARILLAGDAEANEEEYMANGPYTGPLTIVSIWRTSGVIVHKRGRCLPQTGLWRVPCAPRALHGREQHG
jgi:beta-lactamase superfamily II metal-dependent hydrolase